MKVKKQSRVVSFLLAGAMVSALGLAGCGKGKEAAPVAPATAEVKAKDAAAEPAKAEGADAAAKPAKPKDHPAH